MPPKNPVADHHAMKLTPEQDLLSERFFKRFVDLIASDTSAATPEAGIALCVAATEFLGLGMRIGMETGGLSEERARILIAGLSKLLPKTS